MRSVCSSSLLVVLIPAVLVLLATSSVFGAVVSYECDSFPEEDGWQISQIVCDPALWIDAGTFFQHVELCDGYPPPGGQSASYVASVADFLGSPTFFVEWRMMTDGDRSEIIWGGLSSFSAWSTGSVDYTFRVASDQVKLNRDNELPILFRDIEPGVPHVHRLELYGDELYVWYIDGQVMDQGVPEGAFPTFPNSAITWRAKAAWLPNTTQWDYIRYGLIPVDASGDYDTSGTVDAADFYFFGEYFSGEGVDAGPGARWADFDADTDVDCTDWDAFQLSWTDTANDPPIFFPCFGGGPIPAISEWGVAVMVLLVGTCATLVFCRVRKQTG